MKSILIIDDEPSLRQALKTEFETNGYKVTAIGSQKELLDIPLNSNFRLALVDMILPDANGIDLISVLKNQYPGIKVNILTGNGSIQSAVLALQKGAYHYFTKPFELEAILNVCQKAFEQSQLEEENQQLKGLIKSQYSFDGIVGKSERLLDMLRMLKKISHSDATVLIEGENGTGKELVAKAIHFNSKRKNKPFIPVHCGAIPAELLETELFGHVQGAFTGAIKDRQGRFHRAQGGTLFLDEISTMPLSLQVKLLRVLQERQFEPVGSSQILYCDVRIIAATNSKLEKQVQELKFREDLYYRLNVVPVQVPSLRERADDIPLLLKYFVQEMNQKNKCKITKIAQKVISCLEEYPWPGNVRELENLVERLCVLKAQGAIEFEDLPPHYQRLRKTKMPSIKEFHLPDEGINFKYAVNDFENNIIRKALERTRWNRNKAAQLLKMNRTTLIEKMKKKNIKPDDEAPLSRGFVQE